MQLFGQMKKDCSSGICAIKTANRLWSEEKQSRLVLTVEILGDTCYTHKHVEEYGVPGVTIQLAQESRSTTPSSHL